MKDYLPQALIVAAVLGGLAAPAVAGTTAVVAVTLDTAFIELDLGNTSASAVTGFSPPFSIMLAEGDSLDLTIDFDGDQTVTLDGLDSIWAYTFATRPAQVQGTGKFQFLRTDGSVLLESTMKTSIEGVDHFGQAFVAADFPDLPATITFGGVRYVGTVDSYIDADLATRTYNAPGLGISADSITTAVPEPESWLLMLAGVGVLAAAVRRRR